MPRSSVDWVGLADCGEAAKTCSFVSPEVAPPPAVRSSDMGVSLAPGRGDLPSVGAVPDDAIGAASAGSPWFLQSADPSLRGLLWYSTDNVEQRSRMR